MAAASAGPRLVDPHADSRRAGRRRAAAAGARRADHRRARPCRRARRWREAPARASSSWTTACRTRRSPRIFTLAVVDGRRGIGNGRVFPAGPLRAPLDAQLRAPMRCWWSATATRRRREVAAAQAPRHAGVSRPACAGSRRGHGARRRARCWPSPASAIRRNSLRPRRAAGIAIARGRAFPTIIASARRRRPTLIMQAEHDGLALVTTEKDRARMTGDPRDWRRSPHARTCCR